MSVFDKLKSRRKTERSQTEDPAAHGTFLSKNDGSAPELYDFSLIDETVNEWLSIPEVGLDASHSSSTANESKYPTERKASIESKAPIERKEESGLDRVLEAAKVEGLISKEQFRVWKRRYHNGNKLNWRYISRTNPSTAQALERLAARTYGFRPILVCQMSSLVLADLLTAKVSPLEWQQLFESGVAPVVEHGESPDISSRVIFISQDPSDRALRIMLEKFNGFRAELAYADSSVVLGMQELLSQNISAIGASVYVTRPRLKKLSSPPSEHRKAA